MGTWRITKEFKLPIGHRLSCHAGDCANFHGHNIRVVIGLKSRVLNKNGMIMDFSDLKKIVKPILDKFDHALLLNETDVEKFKTLEGEDYFSKIFKIVSFPYDPTAENLSKYLFDEINSVIKEAFPILEFVEIWENDSAAGSYWAD